jgi:hypothetical protein
MPSRALLVNTRPRREVDLDTQTSLHHRKARSVKEKERKKQQNWIHADLVYQTRINRSEIISFLQTLSWRTRPFLTRK